MRGAWSRRLKRVWIVSTFPSLTSGTHSSSRYETTETPKKRILPACFSSCITSIQAVSSFQFPAQVWS
jgi:hypothetical protein